MKIKLTFYLLILICFCSTALAQKIEWGGYGNVGYVFYNRNMLNNYNQETYYEGKLKAEIKFDKNIEGQFDIKGNSTDNALKVQDLNIRFDISDYFRLKIGNMKKPFGQEYLIGEEELLTVNRSIVQEDLAELGYGGRAVGIMAYYKYSEKRPDFPYSYYISVFKDNSLFTSIVSRFSYHINDWGFNLNYMFENKGGDQKISTHAFGGGFFVEKDNYTTMLELFLAQDPFESNRRILTGNSDKAMSFGGRFTASYNFTMDYKFLKKLEPILLVSYFNPDTDVTGTHIIQLIGGANIGLHKKIQARVNADIRFTKNQYNTSYGLDDSRLIFALQMIF